MQEIPDSFFPHHWEHLNCSYAKQDNMRWQDITKNFFSTTLAGDGPWNEASLSPCQRTTYHSFLLCLVKRCQVLLDMAAWNNVTTSQTTPLIWPHLLVWELLGRSSWDRKCVLTVNQWIGYSWLLIFTQRLRTVRIMTQRSGLVMFGSLEPVLLCLWAACNIT